MEKVKIFEIQIVTKRLSRHHYAMDEVSVKSGQDLPEKYYEGSGILMDSIRRREENDQYTFKEHLQDNAHIVLQTEPEIQDEIISEKDATLPKKKKFRKLKKPNFSLFEEVIDEKAILDESINEKINQDHYYDVVAPFDAENQINIQNKKKGNRNIIIGLLALLGILMAALIWIIGDMVS